MTGGASHRGQRHVHKRFRFIEVSAEVWGEKDPLFLRSCVLVDLEVKGQVDGVAT